MATVRRAPRKGALDVAYSSRGIISESVDLKYIAATAALTSQNVIYELAPFQAGAVVSGVRVGVATAGSTLTLVKVGLYKTDGTRVAISADDKANYAASGVWVETSFTSSYTIPSTGGYYLAILAVGTTPPTLYRAGNSAIITTAPASGSRATASQASQADLPATFTLAANNTPVYLAALGTTP
jgi:hypothetical protein